jgi:glucose-1-phosphate thymidylyltransferase
VAGKTSLEHLLDMFKTIPGSFDVEYVFIVGPFLGELQIPAFMAEKYPHIQAHYIVQREMKGQSHAIWLAREHLRGPMISCFSDTLMETDFSFLAGEAADGVAWVKPVPDPRRFGVAELDAQGWVTRFIEKPQSLENNLVVVGCYYFQRAERLLAAIEEQMRRNLTLKNEFFLTDAVSVMIEMGAKVRTTGVDVWLDTGTVQATLETNRFLLEHGAAQPAGNLAPGNEIIPPVSIHPSARIENSVIGPYASVGADCQVTGSRIEDSILEAGAQVDAAALKNSIIGKQARVRGRSAEIPICANIGDDSFLEL